MQAVILAAGYGLRLRPFTETAPKGLVPVLGKPLLEWTLESIPESIDEIIIVTGWLGEQIKNRFGNTYKGKAIRYFEQSPINGTGSALHFAKSVLHDKFLVVNGDDIYGEQDLETLSKAEGWSMLATKTAKPIAGSLVLDSIDNNPTLCHCEESATWQSFFQFNNLASKHLNINTDCHAPKLARNDSPNNANDKIVAIMPNMTNTEKWQNCGAYLTDTRFFDLPLVEIPVRDTVEYSLPHTLVLEPQKCPVKLISATRWLPIGTAEELAKAEELLDNIAEL